MNDLAYYETAAMIKNGHLQVRTTFLFLLRDSGSMAAVTAAWDVRRLEDNSACELGLTLYA